MPLKFINNFKSFTVIDNFKEWEIGGVVYEIIKVPAYRHQIHQHQCIGVTSNIQSGNIRLNWRAGV